MVTFDSIKQHFADLVAKGENAPSTANQYITNIRKTLDDLDGMDDIADCINHRVVKHITETYDHPGSRQGVFLSFLRAINTYPDLKAVVTQAVLTSITEGFELSKTQAKELSIQRQLTETVERMSSIIAKIEAHFEPLSDEVILVNMYDEVALRKDFDDVLLVVGNPPETESRWIDLATGLLTIKDFNKTNKKYDAVRHTLSPRMLRMIREVSATRNYLLTLKSETLFKKMKAVVPHIGSQLLRKSKVSTETEGDKILDAKIRHDLWNQMKHSPETQLTYRRQIIQYD
jgi:hypothetical protein